jgi:Icc-related predicted phosphoesterase
MKILLFSDYHGATDLLGKIPKIVSENSPGLVVFCGDIVKGYARGNEWLASKAEFRNPDKNIQEITEETKEDKSLYEEFYSTMGALEIPVFVIPGNMDAPKSRYSTTLEDAQKKYANIRSLHQRHEKFDEIIFTGFGGEITENQNEDFFVAVYDKTEVIQGLLKAPQIVYVTHTPPSCNKVDLDKTVHKGNSIVNDVLERLKPIAHFCGHAHNGRGTEKVGNTQIINPGAFKNGNFAIVELDGKTRTVKTHFKNCHLIKA